jgi:pilus assembly protein CpaF
MFGRRQASALARADRETGAAPIELGSRPVAIELVTGAEPSRRAGENRSSPASAAPAAAQNDATAAAEGTLAADVPPPSRDNSPEALAAKLAPILRKKIDYGQALRLSRGNLALRIIDLVEESCQREGLVLSEADGRNVVTILISQTLSEAKRVVLGGGAAANGAGTSDWSIIEKTKQRIQPILLDVSKAVTLPPEELAKQISEVVSEILAEEKLQLNTSEQRDLVTALLNDLLGLGPLEVLLADETVSDIMVNGPKQVYVERKGKLQITDVAFRDNAHVMSICTRIVSRIGRRVDETSPLCDARLPDGSRVNIIIPPLALDGPSISIRKFAKHKITLEVMERQQNLSPEMATVLKIAGRCRLNILISGGTGSGKTTLLNALSRMIDHGERIVTIEDAAELQLQQPHVVRLETRPANLEGNGEVTQRDLVKNALRMRPDRIILGEIRGGEALDMLQAMNTGHDGSLGTIHANRPREALTRLENMVAMTGIKLPHEAVRAQIAGALNMIVQISRMRDGVRRITHISEVVGMEGDVITMQDLFTFEYKGEDPGGRLLGCFRCSGLRPHFATQAEYFALDRPLLEAIARATEAAA